MAYTLPSAWYVRGSTGIGGPVDLGTNNNSAGATIALSGVNVPAGGRVVVLVNEAGAATAGTLGDGTNTYNLDTSEVLSGSIGIGQFFSFYYSGAQSGITLTYTRVNSASAVSIAAMYALGTAASGALDSAVTAVAQSTSATPSIASGTPAVTGEWIVAGIAWNSASAITYTGPASSPFAAPFDPVNTTHTAAIGGDNINAGGALPITFAPTLTLAPTGAALMIVGYKPAASGVGWWAVTPWASGTPTAGSLCRQNLTTVGNERVFVCIVSAGSQATEPTWVVTKGAVTTDGAGNKWQECTGQPGVNGDITNQPVWTVSSTPPLGLIIYDSTSSSLQICSTSGAGGTGAKPTFSATAGTTTTDASATWTSLGLASNFAAWAAPHARLSNALTATWAAAGSLVFVGDDHAATQAVLFTLAGSGTGAAPCLVYCVDHTASVPPGGSNLKTTASETMTGTNAFTLGGSNVFNGITFNCGTGAGASIGLNGTYFRFDNCALNKIGTSASVTAIDYFNGSSVDLNNTTMQFGNVGDSINVADAYFRWRNTLSAITGSIIPTILIKSEYSSPIILEGIDLSALGSGKTIKGTGGTSPSHTYLINCKFGAGVTVAATPSVQNEIVDVIVSDSTGTTYQQQRYEIGGTLLPSTSIVRTGGASDGVTPIAWNITTTASAQWLLSFEAFPISIWNTLLSTNRGVTLYGCWNSASLPNNDQIWIEAEYLGSASSPIASFATQTKANGLATGTALTADSSSTWNSQATARINSQAYVIGNVISVNVAGGGGLFFCTTNGTSSGSQPTGYTTVTDGNTVTDGTAVFRAATRFILNVSLSTPQPALIGYIRATVKAALPSSTFYVDPVINLS